MDQRDSYCPYLPSSEATVMGTGMNTIAGQEDPVELDSSLILWSSVKDIAQVGDFDRQCNTTAFNCYSTHCVNNNSTDSVSVYSSNEVYCVYTMVIHGTDSGWEFGWGGTTIKR